MRSKNLLPWLAWSICLLVALILSIRNLREPDLWWMMRTGEWIVQHGQVVEKDPFSFTYNGTPWINVKWLFEVLIYFLNKLAGPEGILILQTLVNGAIVVLIYRLYLLYRRLALSSNLVSLPSIGLILATYLAMFGWEFRMIGRPEMVSHLFLMLFLWVYARWRVRNSKIIYLLIPLQALWTNLHEAFGIGLVVMVTMLAGYWFDKNFSEKSNFRHNYKQLLWATLGAIAAISLNPRGPRMILHPFEIFSQVGENKFTTELLSYKTAYFWQQKEPYVLLLVFSLALIGFFIANRKKIAGQNFWQRAFSGFGYGHGALLIMFFYLAFTAHRNIVFFVLMSAPFVAFTFDGLGEYWAERSTKFMGLRRNFTFLFLFLLGIVAYAAVGSNFYYRHFNNRENYGLIVAPNKNPVGGSEFLKNSGPLTGNSYSDYLTSSYFMWENRPDFKTYVDLRDLDVFPAAFIMQTNQELFYPEIWEKANAKYNFRRVILYQPIGQNLHRYLYQNPKWELSFADAVTAIYTPASENTEKDDLFTGPTFREPSGIANALSKIFWPWYWPELPPHENPDLVACNYYRNVGNYDLALKRARALVAKPESHLAGLTAIGEIYMDQFQQPEKANQPDLAVAAQSYFDQAITLYPQAPGGYTGAGKIALLRGNPAEARRLLEKALILTEQPDVILYTSIAQAIGMQIESGNASLYPEWFRYMELAHDLDPENEQINFIIGLTYCNRGDCKNAQKFLTGVNGYPGVSPQELQSVQQCKMSCRIK